jgi:hypothetical protein
MAVNKCDKFVKNSLPLLHLLFSATVAGYLIDKYVAISLG